MLHKPKRTAGLEDAVNFGQSPAWVADGAEDHRADDIVETIIVERQVFSDRLAYFDILECELVQPPFGLRHHEWVGLGGYYLGGPLVIGEAGNPRLPQAHALQTLR